MEAVPTLAPKKGGCAGKVKFSRIRTGFGANGVSGARGVNGTRPSGRTLRSVLTCLPRMMTTSAAPAAVRAHVNRVPRSAWVIGE